MPPLPTLVIAGAQKCGTTSLTRILRDHPQVFITRPKELHFFDRRFGKGLDWYTNHFTPGPGQVHAGEATPVYMYDAKARARMARTLPDAKIVVILRNPVDRAYSHYWHNRRFQLEVVDSFEEVLALEPERLLIKHNRYSYQDRGHYLEQLVALADGHGRDNLHVMLLDDLKDDRVASLTRLMEFLAIDTSPAETIEEQWTNRYREPNKKGKIVPVAYPPMNPETRSQLVKHYLEHNDRLGAWLGRDLSAWNRL